MGVGMQFLASRLTLDPSVSLPCLGQASLFPFDHARISPQQLGFLKNWFHLWYMCNTALSYSESNGSTLTGGTSAANESKNIERAKETSEFERAYNVLAVSREREVV